MKLKSLGFPLWISGLRIWPCYCSGLGCCCGTGSIRGLGTSMCHECNQKTTKILKSLIKYYLLVISKEYLQACIEVKMLYEKDSQWIKSFYASGSCPWMLPVTVVLKPFWSKPLPWPGCWVAIVWGPMQPRSPITQSNEGQREGGCSNIVVISFL